MKHKVPKTFQGIQ